jgi:hypothetical protein
VRFSNQQTLDFVLRGQAKGKLQGAALWSGALAVEFDE